MLPQSGLTIPAMAFERIAVDPVAALEYAATIVNVREVPIACPA